MISPDDTRPAPYPFKPGDWVRCVSHERCDPSAFMIGGMYQVHDGGNVVYVRDHDGEMFFLTSLYAVDFKPVFAPQEADAITPARVRSMLLDTYEVAKLQDDAATMFRAANALREMLG